MTPTPRNGFSEKNLPTFWKNSGLGAVRDPPLLIERTQ
jgi:hypothetical protein